jgi:hypothetical protein
MYISKVESMNMLDERSSNQRPEVEGLDITGIHMVEVDAVDIVEERSSK